MRRRLQLPVYFVDTSVFVELMLEQEKSSDCASLFQRAEYKFKLVTSTVVMGEILKVINELEDNSMKEDSFYLISDILMKRKIKISSVSFAAMSNIVPVRISDPFLPSSDCLIFSTAVSENSDYFITLDKHFSIKLGKDFKILIRKPYEV